jgi:hypothetical protein
VLLHRPTSELGCREATGTVDPLDPGAADRAAPITNGSVETRTEATMAETVTRQGVNGTARESSNLIESLVDRIGGQARASTIYGDAVERDGVTVIPVARAIWGFGGGSGRDHEQEVGSGGGGGMFLAPVGYIEIRGGSSSFRPIFKPPLGAISLVIGILLGLVIARFAGARRHA